MRLIHQSAIVTLVAVMAATLVGKLPAVQRAGMRFFRDVGRIKARRRLRAGAHNSVVLSPDTWSLLLVSTNTFQVYV